MGRVKKLVSDRGWGEGLYYCPICNKDELNQTYFMVKLSSVSIVFQFL